MARGSMSPGDSEGTPSGPSKPPLFRRWMGGYPPARGLRGKGPGDQNGGFRPFSPSYIPPQRRLDGLCAWNKGVLSPMDFGGNITVEELLDFIYVASGRTLPLTKDGWWT